jgi:hypothetical protein
MFTTGGTDFPAPRLQSKATLWHCEECGAFISIHSASAVREPHCPVCISELLEFCVAFDSGFGQSYGDS